MNTFRTSVLWDRLQPTVNGELSSLEFSRLDAFVNVTTAKGAYVIHDPHDSARQKGTQIGDELLTRMLTHMETNSDVWEGWTWFVAGGCWDVHYRFLAEPTNLGQPNQADKAVMSVLQNFASTPRPATMPTTSRSPAR